MANERNAADKLIQANSIGMKPVSIGKRQTRTCEWWADRKRVYAVDDIPVDVSTLPSLGRLAWKRRRCRIVPALEHSVCATQASANFCR